MVRGFCLALIVALSLGGCTKKETPRDTGTAEVQPPAAPPVEAESDAPDSPAKSEHAILTTVREFLNAATAGNYSRALSLSVPGEITQQSLMGMRVAFQWDQAKFTQAWLGAAQSAVITNFIPAKQGSVTVAWAFNLVATEDGRWLVRLGDVLSTPQIVEDYVAAFRQVAPDAKPIEL